MSRCNVPYLLALGLIFVICSAHRANRFTNAEAHLNDGTTASVYFRTHNSGLIPVKDKFNSLDGKEIPFNKIDSLSVEVQPWSSDSLVETRVFVKLNVQIYEEETEILALRKSKNVYEALVSYRRCTCKDAYSSTKALIYTHAKHGKNYIFLKRLIGDKLLNHQLKANVLPKLISDFLHQHKLKYSVVRRELANFNL